MTAPPRLAGCVSPATVTGWGVLAALAALHLWLSGHSAPGGFLSDDSLYVLMAEWFAGVREPVVEQVARYSHLPPLYSMALAAVGARGDEPLPGHLLNAVLTATALCFTWLWLQRRQPVWLAALAVAIAGLAPGMLLHAFTLWSEPLYMALTMAVLWLLADRAADGRSWVVAAALLGLALLCRSAAIALVVAFAWTALRQRARRPLLLAALVVLPTLGWKALGPEKLLEAGYLGLLRDMLAGTGAATLPEVVTANLQALLDGWVRNLEILRTPAVEWLAMLGLVPVLAGWLLRLRRGTCDAVYVLAYLGMLLIWPATPDTFQRFLLPLLPLAAGYATDAGLLAARRLGSARLMTRALAATPLALLLMSALPSLLLVSSRLVEGPPPALEGFRYSPWWVREPNPERAERVLDHRFSAWRAARALRERLPPEACLVARPVQFYMLHTRRVTWLPGSGQAAGCRYVYASAARDGRIVAQGVPSGSRVVFAPRRVLDPAQPAGMLFQTPAANGDAR